MGILDALRKRSSAVRFSYSFQLRTLSPWPANNGKPIAVAWQRGSKKKKRGVTDAHIPTQVEGQLGTTIHFKDNIQLSATLYMEGNESPNPSGPFKKKCLILAIIESGMHGQNANALGRVVIDLAEFASLNGEFSREFPVACSRNVVAAVGEPILITTIRCAWKSSGGPGSMASSMSSDRTGGTFTTNLGTLVQGPENEQIQIRLTGEQFEDLRGFDRLRTITEGDDVHLENHSQRHTLMESKEKMEKFDSEGILIDNNDHHDNEERVGEGNWLRSQQSYEAPLASHNRDPSLQLKENAEIEMLRNEFCSLDTGGSLDQPDLTETHLQDRTSSWLAGLSLEIDNVESPTLGLIKETTPEQKLPTVSTTIALPDTKIENTGTETSMLPSSSAPSCQHSIEEFDVKEDSSQHSSPSQRPVMETLSDISVGEVKREVSHSSKNSQSNNPFKDKDKNPSLALRNGKSNHAQEIFGSEKDELLSITKSQESGKMKLHSTERRWKRANQTPIHHQDVEEDEEEDSSIYLEEKKNISVHSDHQQQHQQYCHLHQHHQLYVESKGSDHDSSHVSKRSYPSAPSSNHLHYSPLNREAPSSHTSFLMNELRLVAFLEYAVYLARPGPRKYNSRNIHAPARRIVRELGQTRNSQESIHLLKNCLQAIKIMVEASSMDVPGMAFWWTNCLQLRLSISSIPSVAPSWSEGKDRIGRVNPLDSSDSQWAVRKMIQAVLKMEKTIFDRLQQFLWWKVMIPKVMVNASTSSSSSIANTPRVKANVAMQYNENAVQFWLNALTSVYDEFAIFPSRSAGDQGHIPLLRNKLILNCCRLMDSMLFKELLSGAVSNLAEMDCCYWGSYQDDGYLGDNVSSKAWPKLSPLALPFKNGPLTFGVGMHLKMAVTRWAEWIIESNIKHHIQSGDPGQCFFPLLKAAADVLMLPKELLTDENVRSELFSALTIKSMCVLLEKFQPDEFAPDPVNPQVLHSLSERLTNDSPVASGKMMSTVKLLEPPFEATCDGEELDSELEMDNSFDSDSEAAMESLAKQFPSSENAISRFEILRNHWKTCRR